MKKTMNSIKSFLKRWPLFYDLLQRIYYASRQVIEVHMLGTKVQEWIWKTRHLYKGSGWTNGYCKSISHPHRQFLVHKISSYVPLESILEIGCNTGPNLYLLAKKFPKTKLYGIDINSHAIKEGQEWFEQVGIKDILLSAGKADELECFDDCSIDVVFTDAVLLYIGPDKIEKVIRQIERIARKVLIFNEWHWENNSQKQKHFYYHGHWVYNYKALLIDYFPADNIKISKLKKDLWVDSGWELFGAIIEVRL